MVPSVTSCVGIVLGAALCATVVADPSTILPGFCFADGTIMQRRVVNSSIPEAVRVEDLQLGDQVLNIWGGEAIWSTVVGNERLPNSTKLVKFQIQAGETIHITAVSEQHAMFRVRGDKGSNPAASSILGSQGYVDLAQAKALGWQLAPAAANSILPGDLLPVQRQDMFVFGRVTNTSREAGPACNALTTEEGSAVADGVLTSTAYTSKDRTTGPEFMLGLEALLGWMG